MNDSQSSDPNEYQGPAWRNPWLIAFIAGAITITMLRDCTRRVPDAPLSLGAVPTWSLLDVSGTQYSSETLSGRVHILAFGANTLHHSMSRLPFFCSTIDPGAHAFLFCPGSLGMTF